MTLTVTVGTLKRVINESMSSAQMTIDEVVTRLEGLGFVSDVANTSSLRYVNKAHQIIVTLTLSKSDPDNVIYLTFEFAGRDPRPVRYANVASGLKYVEDKTRGHKFGQEGQTLMYTGVSQIQLSMFVGDGQPKEIVFHEFVATEDGELLFPNDTIVIMDAGSRDDIVWIDFNGSVSRIDMNKITRTNFIDKERQQIVNKDTSTIHVSFSAGDIIDAVAMSTSIDELIDELSANHGAKPNDVNHGFIGVARDELFGRVNVNFKLEIDRSFEPVTYAREFFSSARALDNVKDGSSINMIMKFNNVN